MQWDVLPWWCVRLLHKSIKPQNDQRTKFNIINPNWILCHTFSFAARFSSGWDVFATSLSCYINLLAGRVLWLFAVFRLLLPIAVVAFHVNEKVRNLCFSTMNYQDHVEYFIRLDATELFSLIFQRRINSSSCSRSRTSSVIKKITFLFILYSHFINAPFSSLQTWKSYCASNSTTIAHWYFFGELYATIVRGSIGLVYWPQDKNGFDLLVNNRNFI